jgi:hypothetical protein
MPELGRSTSRQGERLSSARTAHRDRSRLQRLSLLDEWAIDPGCETIIIWGHARPREDEQQFGTRIDSLPASENS